MKTFKTPKGTELPLLDLKGKDYLLVPHRIVWFREEKPDWGIETEFLQFSDNHAVAKATIRNELGRIIAQGTKTETSQGFADFMEKAETGSIGRALALCGYGTQFTTDFEEGARLADAPVPARAAPGEFVIGFGKHKNKTIPQVEKEIGIHELNNYGQWLTNEAKKKGEPPSILAIEIEKFCKAREAKKSV